MPSNQQRKRTVGEKLREMVNSEEFRKHHAEHEWRLKHDAEYRAWWQKQLETLNRLVPYHETDDSE